MKYYIVAGEKSGDLHAANLMKALKAEDARAEFRGIGGDRMAEQGLEGIYHIRDTAMMLFSDVVKHFFRIRRILRHTQRDAVAWQPDVVILVDYGGFNLQLAKYTKAHGLTNFYYIAPKVWAWRQQRALRIKKLIDRVFSIIYFEPEFYRKFDFNRVDYVGNPVYDALKDFAPDPDFRQKYGLEGDRLIAVLPGSRKSEVRNMLAIMLEIRSQFPEHRFVVAGVDELEDAHYQLAAQAGILVIKGATYDLLHHAEAAVVTSGTATLETAILQVPQVVCYRMGKLTYQVGKWLVKVRWISLVNLLNQKETVRELIQDELNAEQLTLSLQKVLGQDRARILREYAELKDKIATKGASAETARLMYAYLTQAHPAWGSLSRPQG